MGIWETTAGQTLQAAKLLHGASAYRDAASRAYYAAYQATTGAYVTHGDSNKFPPDMNNPSHEQLPKLIGNNGDLSAYARNQIRGNLKQLRYQRESADYRLGMTVDESVSRRCLEEATQVLEQLGVPVDD